MINRGIQTHKRFMVYEGILYSQDYAIFRPMLVRKLDNGATPYECTIFFKRAGLL